MYKYLLWNHCKEFWISECVVKDVENRKINKITKILLVNVL